jgi:tetratricopeptide (TPR) repeat protein
LTRNNEHQAQKAGIYAKMAELDMRQRTYGNAVDNLQQAIRLDPSNPDYYMLLGDAYTAQEAFTDAREQYEMAIQKGKDDAVAWKANLFSAIKNVQKKYRTLDSEQLSRKMTEAEKQQLCRDIEAGKLKGVRDISIDLLQIAICR